MDRYKHYKGGEYQLLAFAKMESSGEIMAVYLAIEDKSIWIRSLGEFFGTVEHNGRTVPRFEIVPQEPGL